MTTAMHQQQQQQQPGAAQPEEAMASSSFGFPRLDEDDGIDGVEAGSGAVVSAASGWVPGPLEPLVPITEALGPDAHAPGLRQRRKPAFDSYLAAAKSPSLPPPAPDAIPPGGVPPPPRPTLGQRWRRWWAIRRKRAREWYDAVFIDETGRVARIGAWWARNRKWLTGAAVGALVTAVVVLLVWANAIRRAEAEARATAPGNVVWATWPPDAPPMLPSKELTCGEIRDRTLLPDAGNGIGLSRAIAFANQALANQTALACACAPMFGLRRRHLALLNPSAAWGDGPTVLHVFNARRASAPAAYAAGEPDVPTFSQDCESQAMLFPNASGCVQVWRRDRLWIGYAADDAACTGTVARLHGAQARCAQACFDLFEGVSVYQRAAQQSTNGHVE